MSDKALGSVREGIIKEHMGYACGKVLPGCLQLMAVAKSGLTVTEYLFYSKRG